MSRVFLGIGSSLDPEENFRKAFHLLTDGTDIRIVGISTLYWTHPLPDPDTSPIRAPTEGISSSPVVDDPDFLNGVVKIQTKLSKEKLGEILGSVEDALGRVRTQNKYAPRTMDLDILLFHHEKEDGMGDEDFSREANEAHPDIWNRAFVAYPLLELAPDTHLPPDDTPLRDVAHGFPDVGGKADLELTSSLRAQFVYS